jgi:hypothetical protein
MKNIIGLMLKVNAQAISFEAANPPSLSDGRT